MPDPKSGEEKNEYISRCVKQVMDEGETDNKAALGKCYGMWRQAHGGNESIDQIVDKHLLTDGSEALRKMKDYRAKQSDATELRCGECGKEFKKKIGKGTYEVKCPKCGSYDTEPK